MATTWLTCFIQRPSQLPWLLLPIRLILGGLLTFGLAGLGLFVIAWLIVKGRGEQFPRGLSYLGYLSALLLIVLYFARLILLNPANPLVLGTALVSGFLVNPLWYLWLGIVLLRNR